MTDSFAIDATGLEKTYGDIRALAGVGFQMEPGTVFGLLGPNGAGKSTTVKILTTLTRPDAGRAHVAGIDVLAEPARVRRSIGAVAQRSGAIRELTGRENLALQGRVHGQRRRQIAHRASELVDQFGLADAADRVVHTYSGGMQRRLDIAIALMHEPEVLSSSRGSCGATPSTSSWGPNGQGRARTVLGRLEGVRQVTLDGHVLRARVDQGSTALPTVLAALDAERVPVASVTVARPSLDDVYLHYAGRSFTTNRADKEVAVR